MNTRTERAGMTKQELIARLQSCVDDPMWAEHAEVSKNTLQAAIAVLASSGQAASAVPEGMRLVPIEPTDEMEAAAEDAYEKLHNHFPNWKAAYRAMIAAYPAPHEFTECEDCNGTGTQGEEYSCGEFQPPERDRCSSCGGSGQWRIALTASPTQPASAPAGEVAQAWEYSFWHSSAIGHGDKKIGPCLTYDKAQAFGVGCVEQREVSVAAVTCVPFKVETWPVDADGFEAKLCTECGTPVRYGSRHSECGRKGLSAPPAPLAPSIEPVGELARQALVLARDYVESASKRMYDGTHGVDIRTEAKRRLALIDTALTALAAPAAAEVEEFPLPGVAHEHLARIALQQTRDCLEKANKEGLLADTIWFDSACTLFDHIDMVLEEIATSNQLPVELALTCRHSMRSDCALFGRKRHE